MEFNRIKSQLRPEDLRLILSLVNELHLSSYIHFLEGNVEALRNQWTLVHLRSNVCEGYLGSGRERIAPLSLLSRQMRTSTVTAVSEVQLASLLHLSLNPIHSEEDSAIHHREIETVLEGIQEKDVIQKDEFLLSYDLLYNFIQQINGILQHRLSNYHSDLGTATGALRTIRSHQAMAKRLYFLFSQMIPKVNPALEAAELNLLKLNIFHLQVIDAAKSKGMSSRAEDFSYFQFHLLGRDYTPAAEEESEDFITGILTIANTLSPYQRLDIRRKLIKSNANYSTDAFRNQAVDRELQALGPVINDPAALSALPLEQRRILAKSYHQAILALQETDGRIPPHAKDALPKMISELDKVNASISEEERRAGLESEKELFWLEDRLQIEPFKSAISAFKKPKKKDS